MNEDPQAANARARAAGFRDAQQAIAWQRQREGGGLGTLGQIKGATPQALLPPVQQQQIVRDTTSWHPAVIFNRISEALRRATEKPR